MTIFLSTHFMNEAERCDRMSMMHSGKVLAQGKPADLVKERGAPNLETAFIGYLEEAAAKNAAAAAAAAGKPAPAAVSATAPTEVKAPTPAAPAHAAPAHAEHAVGGRFCIKSVWAFARHEAIELGHDTVRLSFALLGPILLMIVFGYGISLDVEHLTFAVFDGDRTSASRGYADSFRASKYFDEMPEITSYTELDRRLRNGELRFAMEIPPGFQRALEHGARPTIYAYVDAAVPFRAETTRNYVEAVHDRYENLLRQSKGIPAAAQPMKVEVRALYNQSFESVYAMVPGDIMLLLMLIPSMLTALSVVREKELGSIANFYAAPATKGEFLLGKLLPYAAVSLVQFATLVALAVMLFAVPIKGSVLTLLIGGIIYVFASTGFGLLISVFSSTQTAAIFAAAIISILPAVQFSGMFAPAASLSGGAFLASKIFPSTAFQQISVGTFTKALGWDALWPSIATLATIAIVYFTLSVLLLKKQED